MAPGRSLAKQRRRGRKAACPKREHRQASRARGAPAPRGGFSRDVSCLARPRQPQQAADFIEEPREVDGLGHERIGPGGAVLQPLDEASVREVIGTLRQFDVQAVAICLLHSFAYPAHERRVAELLRAALPDVAVTASLDVLPVVREYDAPVPEGVEQQSTGGMRMYQAPPSHPYADAQEQGPPATHPQRAAGNSSGDINHR